MLIQTTRGHWQLNSFVVVLVAMVAGGLYVCEGARIVTFSPLKSAPNLAEEYDRAGG